MAAPPVTVWVRLLKPGYKGHAVTVSVTPSEPVMSAIDAVFARMSVALSGVDPSCVYLFPSTKALVRMEPPTSTGDALDPMATLSSVVPPPDFPEFAFLAVVEGACWGGVVVWEVCVYERSPPPPLRRDWCGCGCWIWCVGCWVGCARDEWLRGAFPHSPLCTQPFVSDTAVLLASINSKLMGMAMKVEEVSEKVEEVREEVKAVRDAQVAEDIASFHVTTAAGSEL